MTSRARLRCSPARRPRSSKTGPCAAGPGVNGLVQTPALQASQWLKAQETVTLAGLRALHVFVREYGFGFPIGIDQADGSNPLPLTMQAYGLEGTPSLVLIDRQGAVRLRHFGVIPDLQLGVAIGRLLAA